MKYAPSRCRRSKGYFLSIEALICLSILTITIFQFQVNEKPDLNHELAYQQAQDVVETCIKKGEPNQECFSKVSVVNPRLQQRREGKMVFKRRVNGKIKEIRFKLTSP